MGPVAATAVALSEEEEEKAEPWELVFDRFYHLFSELHF